MAKIWTGIALWSINRRITSNWLGIFFIFKLKIEKISLTCHRLRRTLVGIRLPSNDASENVIFFLTVAIIEDLHYVLYSATAPLAIWQFLFVYLIISRNWICFSVTKMPCLEDMIIIAIIILDSIRWHKFLYWCKYAILKLYLFFYWFVVGLFHPHAVSMEIKYHCPLMRPFSATDHFLLRFR